MFRLFVLLLLTFSTLVGCSIDPSIENEVGRLNMQEAVNEEAKNTTENKKSNVVQELYAGGAEKALNNESVEGTVYKPTDYITGLDTVTLGGVVHIYGNIVCLVLNIDSTPYYFNLTSLPEIQIQGKTIKVQGYSTDRNAIKLLVVE